MDGSPTGAGRVQGEQHCCERPDRSPGWGAARQDAGASRTNSPARLGTPAQTNSDYGAVEL
jgi:hypothetical protein